MWISKLFCFLLHIYGTEIIVLERNFPNGDSDEFTHLEVPESENHIFSSWSVCVSVVSITQKQVAAETPNLVFYICFICKCYLKFLWRSDK